MSRDDTRWGGPRLTGDDRAARNVIGYTLTVSVIIVSVGIVATTGYGQLNTLSQNEQVSNAEAAMELVTDDLNELDSGLSVSRTTEFDAGGGSLTVVNETEIRVNVSNSQFNETFTPRGIRLRLPDNEFTYVTGALVRSGTGEEPRMVSRPAMRCTANASVVPVTTVNATGDGRYIGGDVVSVSATVRDRDVVFPLNRTGPDSIAATDQVNVTVTSPSSGPFERYFERNGNWTAVDGDTYTCTGIDEVYVRQTTIEVSLDG